MAATEDERLHDALRRTLEAVQRGELLVHAEQDAGDGSGGEPWPEAERQGSVPPRDGASSRRTGTASR